MAYSALAVANAFIKRSLENPSQLPDLTPMKLQKLVYFLQAWFFQRTKKPLIDEYFCRWQYGPVLPSLYHEFKEYGAGRIGQMAQNATVQGDIVHFSRPVVPESDTDAWFYIDQIIRRYGHFTAAQLSSLSHQKDGAWALGGKGGDGSPILNEDLYRDIPAA